MGGAHGATCQLLDPSASGSFFRGSMLACSHLRLFLIGLAVVLASEQPPERAVGRCTARDARNGDRIAPSSAPSSDLDGRRRIVTAVRSSSQPSAFGATAPE